MKIQLDTNLRVIRLEESVNLGELAEMLDKLLPENKWKEYKLEVTILQNWSSPIIIERYPPTPIYPWWQPYYTTGDFITNNAHTTSSNGVYNLQLK